MLRALYISLNMCYVSVTGLYVCSLNDFRRMIGNQRAEVEQVYTTLVESCEQMSESLAYASQHPELFPGTYIDSSDLVRCPTLSQQLWLPFPENRFGLVPPPSNLFGVHVLNKTLNGTAWNATALDEEIQFLRPVLHMLPSLLERNPDSPAILFVGHAMDCATVYSYPPTNYCGSVPDGINLCTFYLNRYNLYSKKEDWEADYRQGGHWSEPLTSKGNLINSYSIPVPDATGTFRVQASMSLAVSATRQVFQQMRPSENGHAFILSQEGHVIYAEQPAIDILFGAAAGLTLAKITAAYTGLTVQTVGVSLSQSATVFSNLPHLIKADSTGDGFLSTIGDTNNTNTTGEGYYVAWARFESTLRSWYLVGVIPRDELDNAAVWSISPPLANLSLGSKREGNVSFRVHNSGHLPFTFYVGVSPYFRGLQLTTADTRYTMAPFTSRDVGFNVVADALVVTNSRFLIPFYTTSTGYGSCFRPLFVDLTINYYHEPPVESTLYAIVIVCVLCGLTTILVCIAFGMLYRYRFSPPVLAISPRICILKLWGLFFLLAASVCNIVAPEVAVMCEIARWLFNIGFCLTGAAIVAKNYRLRLIFYSKKLHIVPLADSKLFAFIFAVVLLDCILMAIGTAVEPYVFEDRQCEPLGWVIYVLLLITKIVIWMAAFVNTVNLTRIPMAFTDSRLNGVLIIGSILAAIYVGLQFSGLIRGVTLLFIGSMFTWLGAFGVCCHLLLKLKAGFVVKVKPRTRTQSISLTPPMSPMRLKYRLAALLEEVEDKRTRLMTDKINMMANVEANQRLLFELRQVLLTLQEGDYTYDEEALEKCLPESVRTAFEKNERAINRRLEGERTVSVKPSTSNQPAAANAERKASTDASTQPRPLKQPTPQSKNRRLVVPEIDQEVSSQDSISPARRGENDFVIEDEGQSLLPTDLGARHID